MEEIACIRLVTNELIQYLLDQGYFSYLTDVEEDNDLFAIIAYKVFWIVDYMPRFEYRFVIVPTKDFDDPEFMEHFNDYDCGTDIEKFKKLTRIK